MSLIPRVIVRRWLEVTLALVSLAMLYFYRNPEMMPRALTEDTNLTLWDWILRGMVFGLLGVWGFSALVVLFFLLYSPIYLINKAPHLVGKGGWLDRRELRFYLACFALVCLLVILFTRSFDAAGVLFIVLAGFGPVVWRLLV
ncbi:MAG TPA: hypothetical protein VNC82_11070 [Candidatus Limnocylindria bacterium]|nr:hypothetical protein [Candidatus Limnocylindria bacterium]